MPAATIIRFLSLSLYTTILSTLPPCLQQFLCYICPSYETKKGIANLGQVPINADNLILLYIYIHIIYIYIFTGKFHVNALEVPPHTMGELKILQKEKKKGEKTLSCNHLRLGKSSFFRHQVPPANPQAL